MIEIIKNLPDNVVGFTAKGKVTGEDYESVLIPLVEKKIKDHGKINLLYHLGSDFSGYEASAMWDDAKVGLMHLTAWHHIAVVSDLDWVRNSTKIFSFMMPGHVKVFACADIEEAKEWVTG
ncbi:MAG: STAS/SEC14 domain-containing protein [Victivallaceae bacterium]